MFDLVERATSKTHKSDVWDFPPSFAVAILACVLYGIVSFLLIGRVAQYKAWYMIAIVIGTLMECVAFAARASSTRNVSNVTLYSLQYALTVLAPIFTAAALYIMLGRLMAYVGARFSLLRPSLVSWLFVASDIVSFLIQVIGAVILLSKSNYQPTTPQEVTDTQHTLDLGNHILLGGLAVNLVSFFVFGLQIIYFDYRTRTSGAPKAKWHTLLYALYVSTIFVLIRQFYRVVEFSEGWTGFLAEHEGYFYGLDSLPILLASSVFIWFWPNKYIPRDMQMRLGETGEEWREMTKKEKKQAAASGDVPV